MKRMVPASSVRSVRDMEERFLYLLRLRLPPYEIYSDGPIVAGSLYHLYTSPRSLWSRRRLQ